MTITGPETGITERLKVGDIDGFVVKNNTTTAVTITAGRMEANGKKYVLSADASHTMTSLAAGADFHYLYIDDTASSPPTATIIDSTTEPSLDAAKRGWYNGDDKLVGLVYSPAGSAVVRYFDLVQISPNYARIEFPDFQLDFSLASAMVPSGSWQTPDDNESSVFTPVNAKEIKLRLIGSDSTPATSELSCLNSEDAATYPVITRSPYYVRNYDDNYFINWVILGASRKIKIAGGVTDDNALYCWMSGFGYER